MNKLEIEAKLKSLPDNPGCYLMKDKDKQIIYVGKAKSLKNRVKQYFTGAHDYKTTKLVANIDDFDYVICNNEKEALLLEINLIKQYSPRFNVMFMDDKSYPYIKLTNEEYPMLRLVREKKRDNRSLYFGPYPDVGAARQTINLLNRLYPLRKCQRLPKKACLYFYLNECLAPCINKIEPKTYEMMKTQVINVLKGDNKEILAEINTKMNEASEKLEFEKAKEYHELMQSIKHITTKQQVQINSNIDQDVWHFYADKGYICIQLLVIRSGKLLRKKATLNELYDDESEAFIAYIAQYYQQNAIVKEVLLPQTIDIDAFDESLSFRIIKPQRGHKASLVKMAYDNAQEYLNRRFSFANNLDIQNEQAQGELNRLLDRKINRIEVFDNSHISGTNAVAGMVCFINGKASKKDYRKFTLHQGNDDVASMKEVIYRRYFRLLKEQKEMPDLIMVDGGLTQVMAAKTIIDSLYLDVLILGMVKDKHHNTARLIRDDGTTCEILKESALFFMITRIQDEVHRFALTYHQQKRGKAQTKSQLDDIKGISTVRKEKLLKHFGSYQKLKSADVNMIAEVIPKNVAINVYEALHNVDNSDHEYLHLLDDKIE